MSLMEDIQYRRTLTPDDAIRNLISTLNIVDFGIILETYTRNEEDSPYDGIYCDVMLTDKRSIGNVEVICFGKIDPEIGDGTRCLLFGSRRFVASLNNMLSSAAPIFSDGTVKALPLGYALGGGARLSFQSGISLSGPGGGVSVSEEGSVNITSGDARTDTYAPDGSVIRIFNDSKTVETLDADGTYERNNRDDDFVIIDAYKKDTSGAEDVFKGELTTSEEDWPDKKWQYESKESVEGGWQKTVTIKNADGIILQTATFDAEGNYSLQKAEQSADGGDFLVSMSAGIDGSFAYNVTDGSAAVASITVDPDGTTKFDIGDGSTVLELNPDGSMSFTLADGFTLNITGDITMHSSGNLTLEADGDIALNATASGLLTIGNSVATLGGMISDLLNGMTTLSTVGSPAAHVIDPSWVTSKLTPIIGKWSNVFS
jgi:hypothetical protein